MSGCCIPGGARVRVDAPWPFEAARERDAQVGRRRDGQQCDLAELERRVADATCYTRDHPQAIFYGRWTTDSTHPDVVPFVHGRPQM